MRSQLHPLISLLEETNTTEFDFVEGTIETAAGPGLGDIYNGPFYSYHNWPPTSSDEDERSIRHAYDDLADRLESDGPYDGVVGFSNGGALLAGFLSDYVLQYPSEDLPCRCAIFISSFPPFRMDQAEKPRFRTDGLSYLQTLPTLHVIGNQDFVREHSQQFVELCGLQALVVTHSKGHEVPTDRKVVREVLSAFYQLTDRIAFGM